MPPSTQRDPARAPQPKTATPKERPLSRAARPLWQCPKCGHRFVTANMWHSCRVVGLEGHFKGKPPQVRTLFDAWRAFVEQFGP